MSTDRIIENAVIESATLCINDHGILDCWLTLAYEGSGQGFGGYCLYLPKSFKHHTLESVAGHFLYRVMELAGVEKFEHLKGRTVRVDHDWGKVYAIGHIVKNDWFNPADDFKALKEKMPKKEAV